MVRFLIFLSIFFFTATQSNAILFSISNTIDRHEKFILSIIAVLNKDDQHFIIPNCCYDYHARTLNNENSAVLATLNAGDVYSVNFVKYTEFVRQFIPKTQLLHFCVSLKTAGNVIYSEFFCESNEDSDDFMISVDVSQSGEYQIHAGEIVIRNRNESDQGE